MPRPLKYSVPQRLTAFKRASTALQQGRIDREEFNRRVERLNNNERAFRAQQRSARQEDQFLRVQERAFEELEREDRLKDLADKIKSRETITIDLSTFRENNVKDKAVFEEIVRGQGRWLIRVGNQTYTLNDMTRSRLLSLIEKGMTIKSAETGSDAAVIRNIKNTDTIVFEPIEERNQIVNTPAPVRRRRHNNGFFKYNNITKFDFSRYGIYKNNDPLNYNDTCLIQALRNGGCSEEKLNKIKLVVKNRLIPRSDIPKICELAEIQIRLRVLDNENVGRNLVYGKEYTEIYNIGSLDDHAFIIEPTTITSYCLKNYNAICNESECNKIYGKVGAKYYRRDDAHYIDSFDVVKTLLAHKDTLLKEITLEDQLIASTQFYDKVSEEIMSLEYSDEKCCRPIEELKEKQNKFKNVFFDFETDPNGVHKPYLCRTFDGVNHKEFIGENCGLKMLFSLTTNTRLIAHNCTYDFRFIIQYLTQIEELARGNRLISAKGKFRDLEIEVKDSYHLISMPLRAFPKVFGIKNAEKEVMPYSLYTQENISKRYVPIEDALNILPVEEHQQFKDNLVKWDCEYEGDLFDMIQYSSEYCKIDCEILYSGYIQFRQWIKSAFKLDIDTILTCASLAHRYFVNEGCYEGVYELGGVPQMFIQGCVVGGRVMTSENKKIVVNDIVNDFDAVSLYPSAMSRMDGFLKGKPKVIENLSYDWLSKQDGYFVDIKINSVGIKRKFPLMSYKDENGIRMFSNEMVGRTFRCDKTTLEDIIKYQGITFEIVRGYYFNEGLNTKVRDVIKYIFNKRLEEKKNKNPVEMVYKLIMNSGYGKSIMKPVETRSVFFDTHNGDDEFLAYLNRNYNWITSYVRFGNKVKVNLVKTLIEHFNIAQVGVSILSQSKRIMNEVMCLAEDNNIDLYYQDTDSIHLKDDDISKLAESFKARYGRELIGKGLGQFHSDFSLDNCSNIVATKSIFLGKKCYIDKLKGIDADGNEQCGYHIRMKGIPEKCIHYIVDTLKDEGGTNIYNDVMELYEDLYAGNPVAFDLTNGGTKANFKFNDDYTIETLSMFSRTIQFK